MPTLQEEFKTWMGVQIQANKKPYSDSTIKNYDRALRSPEFMPIVNKLLGTSATSVYELNKNQIKDIIDELENGTIFRGCTSWRSLRSALKKYREFL